MFTLKIKWMLNEDGEVVDESTMFIPADQVTVHGVVKSGDMQAWVDHSYFDYTIKHFPDGSSRLITVERNGVSTWYLASMAWLMGSDGKTIERLV